MPERRVPFADVSVESETFEAIMVDIRTAARDGKFIMGERVRRFEQAFASAHNVDHCLAVSNGTAALHLIFWSLGIGTGDEVILPTNTFAASAEAIVLAGARPVFVDHDEYYGIDAERIESAITSRTKAILAVHLYGQAADMDSILAVATKHKLQVIEDAAQAHLAKWRQKRIGNFGIAAGFSFYPAKNLGAWGEGGAVITNDEGLANKLALLRNHGSESKYLHTIVGHNYRLEEIQGIVLEHKLQLLAAQTVRRQHNANLWGLALDNIAEIKPPQIRPGAEHVWHLYVIEAERRDQLQAYLDEYGVSTGLHYPTPLHLQPAFASSKDGHDFPIAEASAKRILSLPMFPNLTEGDIQYCAGLIRRFYSSH